MPFNFPSLRRSKTSNHDSSNSLPSRDHAASPQPGPAPSRRGLLQKQKATLHWAERFCWIEAGEFRWAEPSRDDSRIRGRERGGVNCVDVHEARRTPGDRDRPHQFCVRTARGTVKFAAASSQDADAWAEALRPRRDVALLRERCWQFPARFVRSEEVVVTATASGGVVLSKYVGRGGFRLRIDGIGDATPEEIHVAPGTLRALGLANADDADPLCVVAAGTAAWSRAEHDAGSCLLALGPDGRREWKAMVEDVVAAEAPAKGINHSLLAGWRCAPDGAELFGEGGSARTELADLETWLDSTKLRLVVNDERWRFPTRDAPPASSLLERRFVVSVSSGGSRTLVPCSGAESARELLDEVLEKLRDRSERPPSSIRSSSPPLPPRPPSQEHISFETPETVALRLKGRRSYLLRLDAPIVANADVADALRASVARVPTVELVLERDLNDGEQSLLTAQRKRLDEGRILYDAQIPANEVAQALRSKPPDVDKLATFPDGVLETFVPQLCQALKRAQPGDFLTKFLLERALTNPVYVGSRLFWALRCEMGAGGAVSAKHGALLACYLGACGSRARGDLAKQVELDRILADLTTTAAEMDDRRARTHFARQRLKSLARSGELPADLDLPCAPGRRVGRIRAEMCKVLSSKAAPLLMHFDDAEDESLAILAIYKTRDDLRQDAAMLQVMRQMDRMWLDAGLESWLRTYSVCATQPESGWIEVVSDAHETAEVQQTYGGGMTGGAFQSNTLNRFLEDKNRDDSQKFPACVERFAASCAACCVATYALGVADRHNGNIMLSKDGRLFHIDFGHVLGHFKRIRGSAVRRERTKLVLTPEMMFLINKTKVLDGSFVFDDSQSDAMKLHEGFGERCQALLDVLNRPGHVALLLQTLKELVPAGLPEITDDSLAWLPTAVTSSNLKAELKAALADWVRRLDNANHNRVHRESGAVAVRRERPASTLMEAHVEVEELRTLLSRANARADALQRDLDAARGLDGSARPSGSRVL